MWLKNIFRRRKQQPEQQPPEWIRWGFNAPPLSKRTIRATVAADADDPEEVTRRILARQIARQLMDKYLMQIEDHDDETGKRIVTASVDIVLKD